MEKAMESCMERFTTCEKKWWRDFIASEKARRNMWSKMSDEELKQGGKLDWPLKRLKRYREHQEKVNQEATDVSAKGNAIKDMIAKRNTFKKVCVCLRYCYLL